MRKTPFILIGIIVIAFILRLYKIDNPIADWHSWRQADTSAVTRNFLKFGFNPLYPRYDDLSNIQTGRDNPEGYRFVEFPFYNAISYFLITIFGQNRFSIEIWQRLVSIISSLFSLYFIYKITTYFSARKAGLFAAALFGFLPYSVYYSRVILPEPLMVCLSLAAVYCFFLWFDCQKKIQWLLLSAFFGAAALLVKPFAVFFFPPLLFSIYSRKNKLTVSSISLLALYALIVLVPLFLWRSWISFYPEGVPASDWLYNKDNIRFKGAFFNWLFAERLSKLILGYVGIFFLGVGVLVKSKQHLFFHALGLSMLLYVTIFAGGNVQHDYYQVITVPIIVMYMGIGISFLLDHAGTLLSKATTYIVVGIVLLFTYAFSWYQIRGYYWINNQAIVTAGKEADQILPENAKVIAPYGGDTAFLYQINRQGWPIGFEIEDKIKKGATHYVSVAPQDPEAVDLANRYTLIKQTDGFVIISLQ